MGLAQNEWSVLALLFSTLLTLHFLKHPGSSTHPSPESGSGAMPGFWIPETARLWTQCCPREARKALWGNLSLTTQPVDKEPQESHLAALFIFQMINEDKSLGIFLNWTSPPIFNMRQWKQGAAVEWSPGPRSTGRPGIDFLLGGGGQAWWNKARLPMSATWGMGGAWALMWGLLTSQVPALQWWILQTYTHHSYTYHTHTHTHTPHTHHTLTLWFLRAFNKVLNCCPLLLSIIVFNDCTCDSSKENIEQGWSLKLPCPVDTYL